MIVYQWPFEIAAGIYRAGLYSMLIGREPVNPLHCDLCRACGTGREPTAQQKAVAGVEVGDGLLQAGMVRSPVRLSPTMTSCPPRRASTVGGEPSEALAQGDVVHSQGRWGIRRPWRMCSTSMQRRLIRKDLWFASTRGHHSNGDGIMPLPTEIGR